VSRRGRHNRHPQPQTSRPRPGGASPELSGVPAEVHAPARPELVAETATREPAGQATRTEARLDVMPPDVTPAVVSASLVPGDEPALPHVERPVGPEAAGGTSPEPSVGISAAGSATLATANVAAPRPDQRQVQGQRPVQVPAQRQVPSASAPIQPAPGAAAQPGDQPGSGEPRDAAPMDLRPTCTVAQLRRFIKSRPWIPMHELRRRFGIYGGDDDVTPIRVGAHTLFIGLPPAEGRLMGELLGSGDVGYELSLDPVTPVVVGVYPMRPVPRG